MATKEMIQEIEEKNIDLFRKEFQWLCEKYSIGAIVIGARSETEKFEDSPNESMCAAFCSSSIKDPSLNQLKAIDSAFDKAEEEIISSMHRDIAARIMKEKGVDVADLAKGLAQALQKAFGGNCECKDCKKEAESEASEKKEV